MASNTFTVGQEVVILAPRNRFRPNDDGTTRTTVTKVGRKYVYVDMYGREVGFHIADGRPASSTGGYSLHLYTIEKWAEFTERNEALDRVYKGGLEDRGSKNTLRSLTNDQLNRIADVLEEPRG
jgi:hypothetical protein